jgi:hypothetical protein
MLKGSLSPLRTDGYGAPEGCAGGGPASCSRSIFRELVGSWRGMEGDASTLDLSWPRVLCPQFLHSELCDREEKLQ